jgi:hypothetical protein
MSEFINMNFYPKPILFFDNDPNNFREIKKDNNLPIECIQVEEIPINAVELYNNAYKSNNSNNYIKWLKGKIDIEALKNDTSPSEALNDTHINYIKKWAHITNGMYEERYVLFDWDRTLSMWEGFYTFDGDIFPFDIVSFNRRNSFTLKKSFAEDMVSYLLDNENNRLQKIKDLISELLDKNIQVIIVTNNSSLLNITNHYILKNLNIWIPLLQELDPRLSIQNLVYGGLLGKYEAIYQRIPNIQNLHVLETYTGGRKIRKRSKINKRRKPKTLRKTKRIKKI